METVGNCAVALTSKLVRIDSTTGSPNEREPLDLISHLFDAEDYTIGWGQNKMSLVVLPRRASGQILLFSGHVDAVSFEQDEWSFSPVSGEVKDGKILGRGASDMKSGVAAQVAAMKHAGPAAPVGLALSTREEWGCAGSPDVITVLKDLQADVGAILVAEPTDGKLLLGHKGPLWLEVTIKGRSAHGSMPELGENAILKAASLALRAEEEMPRRTHWRLGKETMNVGIIQGGTMRNIVPDRAVLNIDIRTVDEDVSPILSWWNGQPEVANLRIVSKHAPVWTDPSDAWVSNLPLEPEAEPATYGTEAAPLGVALGHPPTVIWGPGPRTNMHVVDESADCDDISLAAEQYMEAIRQWGRLSR
jgi:Acetylornithine deacetylase/Succinyl-diaminopimelate desuccinylase and related deacylases